MFGEILLTYRKKHELSQQQLSIKLGLSRNYVSQIERGLAENLSFKVAQRILNIDELHGQVWVVLTRRVLVDAVIAPEIVWLNSQGVVTEGCCAGPPPTAMITPGSVEKAQHFGYVLEYQEHIGLFEIMLKSK